MTRNEILGEILQRWCYGNKEYIKPAYAELCKTDALARRKVWHSTYVDKDFIFSGLDSVINYLQDLKKEGYTCLEEQWNGYNNFSICASKYEDETDNEYYDRLREHLYRIIKERIKVETQNKGKAARIAELKAELKRLEGES